MEKGVHCWCGGTDLSAFSPDYGRCSACGTLVSLTTPVEGLDRVTESEEGLYGRDYWFTHQTEDYGHPTILERARSDLSERCLWWLRTILRFKLPPASALEVGCAHGGAVALLKLAGFDALGVELSPWVVKFARETFDVHVLQGSVDEHPWSPGSFDVIALFDVLEHLVDPVRTMRRCVEMLKPDGILVIQTPCVQEDASFERLSAETGALIRQLVPAEHLFLFTEASLRRFLSEVGCGHVDLVPAVFPDVDMFLVASPWPLRPNGEEAVAEALSRRPEGRFVQAFLDLYRRSEMCERAAKDATAKVTALEGETLTLQHEKLAFHNDRQTLLTQLEARYAEIQGLHNDRLVFQAQAEALYAQIQGLHKDRLVFQAQAEALHAEIQALHSDRLALQDQVEALQAGMKARETQMQTLQAEMEALQGRNVILTGQRDAFLASRLGRLQTFQARIRARVRRAFGVAQP